jgi:hypothetical protein
MVPARGYPGDKPVNLKGSEGCAVDVVSLDGSQPSATFDLMQSLPEDFWWGCVRRACQRKSYQCFLHGCFDYVDHTGPSLAAPQDNS